MKLLYQYWREEQPTILSLRHTHSHTHFPPFPLLVAHAHTKTNRLNFLYLVSVFNQCLRSISLSSTFPHPSPGVHGNWTLTNAYVSNFADGGGAAKRAEQGGRGGWRKREEEWEMGFVEIENKDLFVFKAFPWKCWGEANALSLDRWRFHLLLTTASFFALSCACMCVCGRERESRDIKHL